MRNTIVSQFEERIFKGTKVHPSFRPGDTVKVNYKVEESGKSADGGKKYRIQAFEGVCIRFKKGGAGSSFTVRKVGANGVGVERIFPVVSPYVDSIELLAGGRVRRARLYYLRNLSGKAARIRSRRLPPETQLKTIDTAAKAVEGKKAKKEKPKKPKK